MDTKQAEQTIKTGFLTTISSGHDTYPGASGRVIKIRTDDDGNKHYTVVIETVITASDVHCFCDADGNFHDVESWL